MKLRAQPGDDRVDLDRVDVADLAVFQADGCVRTATRANNQHVLELAGAEQVVRRAVEPLLLIRRQHRLVAALVDVERVAEAVVGPRQADLVVRRPPVAQADVPGDDCRDTQRYQHERPIGPRGSGEQQGDQ